jgi:hypothetical protein
MTYAEYERRANEIDAWAKAQYDTGKLSEDAIERAAERMFDKLDDEYMPARHAGFTGAQSYSDFLED